MIQLTDYRAPPPHEMVAPTQIDGMVLCNCPECLASREEWVLSQEKALGKLYTGGRMSAEVDRLKAKGQALRDTVARIREKRRQQEMLLADLDILAEIMLAGIDLTDVVTMRLDVGRLRRRWLPLVEAAEQRGQRLVNCFACRDGTTRYTDRPVALPETKEPSGPG